MKILSKALEMGKKPVQMDIGIEEQLHLTPGELIQIHDPDTRARKKLEIWMMSRLRQTINKTLDTYVLKKGDTLEITYKVNVV